MANNYPTRKTEPSQALVLNQLKGYIYRIADAKSTWRHYKWFYATQCVKDMPVGRGAFIVMAGILRPCHEGWYFVANTATFHELRAWEHWNNCIAVTNNKQWTPGPPGLAKTVERKLGTDDPQAWIRAMSSRDPNEWVYIHGSGLGKTLGRPKKVVDAEQDW